MNTDNAPARMLSTDIVSDASTNQNPASTGPLVTNDESNFDKSTSLLARVDFKWLMAGQGWWIDPHRFESDGAYAVEVLLFALASESRTLRACAAALQTQLCEPVSH